MLGISSEGNFNESASATQQQQQQEQRTKSSSIEKAVTAAEQSRAAAELSQRQWQSKGRASRKAKRRRRRRTSSAITKGQAKTVAGCKTRRAKQNTKENKSKPDKRGYDTTKQQKQKNCSVNSKTSRKFT